MYKSTVMLIAWALFALGEFGANAAEMPTPWNYMKSSKTKWKVYDEKALAQARQLQRPLFVLIYLDTCHWCRKYEMETLESAKIRSRLQKEYIPIAIDFATQPELAKRLGATLVPTTLLLTPDGRRLVKFQGYAIERDLADILDANLYRWRKGEISGDEFGDPGVCCPLEDAAAH